MDERRTVVRVFLLDTEGPEGVAVTSPMNIESSPSGEIS
jgi:hypothetical protein